jgi:hypothetical protein
MVRKPTQKWHDLANEIGSTHFRTQRPINRELSVDAMSINVCADRKKSVIYMAQNRIVTDRDKPTRDIGGANDRAIARSMMSNGTM